MKVFAMSPFSYCKLCLFHVIFRSPIFNRPPRKQAGPGGLLQQAAAGGGGAPHPFAQLLAMPRFRWQGAAPPPPHEHHQQLLLQEPGAPPPQPGGGGGGGAGGQQPQLRLQVRALLAWFRFLAVLRIRDFYTYGSRNRIFPSWIQSQKDPWSGCVSMNLSKKIFLSSRKNNLGCSSRIRILSIPDLGVKKQKSRIRIRNTGFLGGPWPWWTYWGLFTQTSLDSRLDFGCSGQLEGPNFYVNLVNICILNSVSFAYVSTRNQ